jgi:hypothetical protein
MEHLHSLFTDFVVAPIKTGSTFDHRTQTSYQWCVFATLSFVCFAYYRNLFYDPAGKKIVPSNIGELLTAVGLAYWICDDGHFHKASGGHTLATNSLTLSEVELLIKVRPVGP